MPLLGWRAGELIYNSVDSAGSWVAALLLAGVLLQIPTWLVFPMAIGYVLLRFLAKVASGSLLAGLVPFDFEVPKRVGLGLIPQGGIAVAMAAPNPVLTL